MTKLFFSIVIPTLNEENYLPNLLNDLQKQKEKNFEVIIVDGKSIDKTKQVVKKYSKKLSVFFIECHKKNVSFQRNIGADKSKGKYVIFLDADSRISALFTQKLKKIILSNKSLIYIPHIVPDEKNSDTKLFFMIANSVIELSQSLGRPLSSGGSMIVEKNFFQLIEGFPEDVFMSEDHQLIMKAHDWKVRAVFLPKIKIKFSLRRMKREGKLKMFIKVIYSFIHLILNGKVDKKIFEYEMGGHLYKYRKKEALEVTLKKYLKQTKKFFDELF